MTWYFTVVLICIFPMINDVEHFFINLLDVCLQVFFRNVSFICPFSIRLFICCCFIGILGIPFLCVYFLSISLTRT